MITFVKYENDYSEAKEVALKIISNLHESNGDNYEVSLQALEIAFISLLEEEFTPLSVFTALVLENNLDEIKRVVSQIGGSDE